MALSLALWRMSLQEALQYRAEALIWTLFDVLPPIMMAFLWLAAYEGQASVAGYDLGTMLIYTVGVMVLRAAITTHAEWDIARQVREGTLSIHLVRPMSPWTLWLVSGVAWRTMRLLIVTPIMIGCLVWLVPHLEAPNIGPDRLPLLALSVVLGFWICFFVKLCIGFLSFWLTEITGVLTLYEVTAYVFGGVLLPLDLLPTALRDASTLLPFASIYYVPLAVLLGRLEGPDLATALAAQLGWTVGLGLLAYILWRRGLRHYEAVGG